MAKIFRFSVLIFCVLIAAAVFPQNSEEQQTYSYADQLYRDGLYDIAIEQYQQYLDQFPRGARRPDAALYIGRSHFNLEEYEEALQRFMQVGIDYPESVQAEDAQWMVGETYEAQERWAQAARALQRFYTYYPESERAPEALLTGARDATRAGNDDLAIEMLQTTIDNFLNTEDAIDARIQLASIYERRNQYAMAWNELDKAMNASPSDARRGQILFARAGVAEQRWGNQRAAELYEQIRNEFEDDQIGVRASLELAQLAMEQRNYSRADEIYSDIEDSDDDNVRLRALENHGDLFWAQQDYESARSYYAQAMDLINNPIEKDTLWVKYALALENSGQIKPANVQFSEIVQPGTSGLSDNVRQVAYAHLASTSISLEHYTEAAAALQNLLGATETSQHPSVYRQIGDIYADYLGNFPRAIQTYSVAIDSFPYYEKIDSVLYARGRAEINAREYVDATRSFRRIIDRYPSSGLFDAASDQLWYLQHFHTSDQQLGFEKLASLFGDLLLERDRQDIFFELGKLYFQNQQSYLSAIDQFDTLEELGNLSQALRDSLIWYTAESYRILENGAMINQQPGEAAEYRQAAIDHYEQVVSSDRITESLRNQARFYLAGLYMTDSPEQAASYFSDLVDVRDYAIQAAMKLANIYREQGERPKAISLLQRIILDYDYTNDSDYANAVALAADIAAESNQQDLASNYFNRYLRLEPEGSGAAYARWQLLRFSMENEDYQQARQYAQSLKTGFYYSPYASEVDDYLGQILIRSGDYTAAAGWYQNLAESATPVQSLFIGSTGSNNKEAIYWTAYANQQAGYQGEAAQYYRWYTQEGNNNEYLVQAYQFLADMSAGQQNYQEARGLYLQAAEMLGDAEQSLDLEVKAANMLYTQENYAEAAPELRDLSQQLPQPERFDVWEKAIIAYIREGNLDRADSEIATYQRAADLPADSESLLTFRYERSKVLAENKRFEQSLEILADLSEFELSDDLAPKVRYELGRQYVLTNEYEQAIDLLTQIPVDYADSPVVPQAYLTLGTVLTELEQPGNAIEAFQNSLDHGATGIYRRNAMNNLINLYESTGIWNSALSLAQQYIQEFPNAENVLATRIQIGRFLTNMREFSRARDHLQELLREADSETAAEIQYYIGETYFEQNNYKQAITEYLKVPYLNPNTRLPWDVTALYKAGNAYEYLGQNDQAITLYERIISSEGASSNYGRFARRRIDELAAQQPQ